MIPLRTLTWATWARAAPAGLPAASLGELGLDAAGVAARVRERLEGAASLEVVREHKGKTRHIDVREHLVEADGALEVEVGSEAEREALRRAGLLGDLVPIRFATKLGHGVSAKPTEVVEALLGAPVHARLLREGLYARRDGVRRGLFELEALRAPRRERTLASTAEGPQASA